MQHFAEIARAARFAAMQPQTEREALAAAIARAHASADDAAGAAVFHQAAWWAGQARMWRQFKAHPMKGWPAGRCEARAREAERMVRQIAQQAEAGEVAQ